MNFNLFNSIILAGIIQGLVFGLVVPANRKYRSTGTLLLVAFIVSFSLDNLQYLLEDIGLITEEQLYAYLFIPFELLSGPLLLLYGLYLMHPDRAFTRKDKCVFIPFVVGFIACLLHKTLYAMGMVAPDVFFDVETLLEFVAIAIDVWVLLYLTWRLHRFAKLHSQASPQLKWFRIVLVLLLILSVVWVGITIADYFYDTEYWYILYISMSAVIYWMGHVGIYNFGREQERKKDRLSTQSRPVISLDRPKNEHIAALENLLIGQKRFLDPKITLDKMADELDLSKSHLSRIINTELQMGFPDYLNALRVAEAKIYLRHPDFANYTLLAIGLEAGFNSKTTFNAAFRKFAGCTPSDYRNALN